jgi:ribosomal silencing factor RsfS
MAKKNNSNDVLLTNIIKGIEEVKGNDIDILDLREIDNSACDYFVICTVTCLGSQKLPASSKSVLTSRRPTKGICATLSSKSCRA